MNYFSERNVMKELRGYSKAQFEKNEITKEKDGCIFYSFKFSRKGAAGYITARYNPNKKIYESINMDCNFCRPAGYNNYTELKDVMDHIRSLFKI
ncbi:hypothetical protein QDR06_02095 [Clostridium perfringens]|uniref:hypothetical protein n=1 Tax=Clostridium perfringens TaxID=1502 RepID=UPI0024473599|nr:hypothetical protein [Clostridium perfringens]MDH2460346.1 hypothetical protein [Clostridium perfringens]